MHDIVIPSEVEEPRGESVKLCTRMTISLNGENIQTRDAKTVAELVESYQLPPQSILVEHNGRALHRRDWPQQALGEGDRVEFVRVVAGG